MGRRAPARSGTAVKDFVRHSIPPTLSARRLMFAPTPHQRGRAADHRQERLGGLRHHRGDEPARGCDRPAKGVSVGQSSQRVDHPDRERRVGRLIHDGSFEHRGGIEAVEHRPIRQGDECAVRIAGGVRDEAKLDLVVDAIAVDVAAERNLDVILSSLPFALMSPPSGISMVKLPHVTVSLVCHPIQPTVASWIQIQGLRFKFPDPRFEIPRAGFSFQWGSGKIQMPGVKVQQ